MGIVEKLSKILGLSKGLDLEQYLGSEELEGVDVLYKGADRFVKPLSLQSEADVNVIETELAKGNIILANFSVIAKQENRMKRITTELKTFVEKIDGDIARIGEVLLLITPKGIKIIKKKK